MNKLIITSILIFLIFSCKSKNCICEQDISLKILNDSLTDNDTIKLMLINNTKKRYFLPFDFNLKKYNRKIQEEYRNYFYPNIGIYKNLNDIKEVDSGFIINTGHYENIDKVKTSLNTDKDLTKLDPYEEKIIKIPFSNIEAIPNDLNKENIYCVNNGIYFLELEYYIDSEVLTKILDKNFNIRSDYQCFNGRLVSNKVILFISKK